MLCQPMLQPRALQWTLSLELYRSGHRHLLARRRNFEITLIASNFLIFCRYSFLASHKHSLAALLRWNVSRPRIIFTFFSYPRRLNLSSPTPTHQRLFLGEYHRGAKAMPEWRVQAVLAMTKDYMLLARAKKAALSAYPIRKLSPTNLLHSRA